MVVHLYAKASELLNGGYFAVSVIVHCASVFVTFQRFVTQ